MWETCAYPELRDELARVAESLEPEVAKLRKQIEQLGEDEKRIRNQMLEP